MLVYCSLCVCNLFIRAGNRGRWPASVKLVTLHYECIPASWSVLSPTITTLWITLRQHHELRHATATHEVRRTIFLIRRTSSVELNLELSGNPNQIVELSFAHTKNCSNFE